VPVSPTGDSSPLCTEFKTELTEERQIPSKLIVRLSYFIIITLLLLSSILCYELSCSTKLFCGNISIFILLN
jgi:hypothetical protein